MSRPPAHPKGWAPAPSVTSPPVSFRPATPTRHSPIHRLPPPYIPCPKPMKPTSSPLAAVPPPFRYPSPCPSPQVMHCYDQSAPTPYRPREFVVLEAPQQWSDDDSATDGRSTADIIASQSQDYVDEKLAEYQATIYMLQVVCGGGFRDESGDETYEEVLEEHDVYTKDGRKKGKMVIVNMVTVHKSVKIVTSTESSPVLKHSLSFDRESSMSRSSSKDSLSSPKSWRKSFVGTRSQFDLHIEEIKNEQERVQKKTFVNWINSYLCQRIPPLKIDDLIEDLKDGTKLLALLEVLSGERLAIERGRNMRRPHFLSNVNTAIQFLQSKRIKLVNINSADIVDGRPPIVLGLVWTIILYFQLRKFGITVINDIEENTKGLASLNYSFSGSTSSLESIRSPTMEINRKADGAKKTLLKWVGTVIPKESKLNVKDFGPSWRDGIAFLTIIDTIQTNLVDITTLRNETNRRRLETAFNVAEQDLGITRLLDPEDVDVDRPDERSVMTYVAQFVHKYPEVRSDSGESIDKIEREYNILITWLNEKTQHLSWPQNLSRNYSEYLKLQDEIVTMSNMYNRLKKICNSGSSISISSQSWNEIERLWILLENLMRNWQWQLDLYLPEPFKVIGEWITNAEHLINDNDIPSIMNEETAVIISKKLEDHKSFFADFPEVQQKFNELLIKTKNKNKEVNDLSRRLNIIEIDSHKRRTHLKFLEHKCCLIAFLNLTENKLKAWTVKYGHQQDVLQLLEKYNNFVIGNNIFQEFNKAYIDMQNVVQEYKHECNIEYKESVAIEKFMRQTAEQWKSIAMELRCAQSMLEEVISYWRRWKTLSEEIKMWLTDAVKKINLPHEQRINFFQDIGVWKEKYELLNDTVSFLIATCEDSIGSELKQIFLSITNTWESIFSKAKDYMHSGDVMRNRKEYLEGLDILHKWIAHAEQILSSIHLSSSQKIKDYLIEIQNLQIQLDEMDDLFKTISKKFQVLIKDLTRDEVNDMMICLKKEKESLVNIRASIPIQLNALHHMLVQYDALETGQQEINNWLNNCEEFLFTLKLSKSQEELHNDIEYLKSIIVRMSYYQSMLSSKNKIFQNIIKSIQPEKDQGNNAEFVQTMADLNAKFSRISQECQQWDIKLQQTLRCWHNFIEIEKVILDWIETTKQIFLDEQTSSRQTLESQKNYFEYSNNNKWISELDNVEGELLRCILPSEQETIKNRSKALKLKYQDYLNLVPTYITKVEYKLNEMAFNQCMNEAEKELNIEQQMFSRNENVNLILKRNIEYFDNSAIFKELKTCLNNMSNVSKKIPNSSTDLSLTKSFSRFEMIEKKFTEIRQKCKQIPNQLHDYQIKFNDLERWMNAVDLSVERLLKGILNDEEFEKEKSIFQEICCVVDSKRDDMKWMVQTLDSILPYVSEEQQQIEQKNLEVLIGRYKHLIPNIDLTITKTEMYTKYFLYKKEVIEIENFFKKTKDEQSLKQNESMDDLSELILNQEQLIDRLEKQRVIVMSTLQRGKQLVKSSSVPNFIPQLVFKLEKDWSFIYNESIDKFNKLKNAQRLLIEYTTIKNEVMEIIKKAENELKTVSDDNKHNSREISIQLRSKQELSLALREAAENMLNKLRDISQNLHIPEKEFAIENEINVIENKLVNTIQIVDNETRRLEKLSIKLCELDSGLNKIHVWSVESAPAVIERIEHDQTNPEVKARGIEKVQDELQKQRNSLERLTQDLHSFEKETDTNETQKLRQDLDEVRMSILNLECNTNRKNEEISLDLNEWQIHKAILEEIRPWLENIEKTINIDHVTPITLQLANDLLKNAQLINSECNDKIESLKTITAGNKTAVILNEVDAIQSRCISVQSSAIQQTNRLKRLLLNWKELNEKSDKIEEKLNRPLLSELNELNLNQSFSEDLLEKKLLEHKVLYQELNECHSEISSLSQTLNGTMQHFSNETTSDIKKKLTSLKIKNNEYLKLIHDHMQIISNIISDKKEHVIKLNNFCEWLNELDSKVNNCNIVPTNLIEETIKKLHSFTEEHMEKQPLFSQINDDLKLFHDNVTIHQSIIQFKKLQDLMQKKKILLERANDFFIWNETILGKLSHIEFHFDTNQDKTNLINDINKCSEEVELWKENINSIENLLQQSKTTIPGLSITEQFKQIQLNLVKIQDKLKAKYENEQKVKDCQKTVGDLNDALLKQIKTKQNALSDDISSIKSWNNIILMIPKLEELSDINKLVEKLKIIEAEGEILSQLDKSSSIFVENILVDINNELSNLKIMAEQSITNLTKINDNWLTINDVRHKMKLTEEGCKTILGLVESPNDLTEAQIIEEQYNKALKQCSTLSDSLTFTNEAMQQLIVLSENYPQLNVVNLNQDYHKDLENWEKFYTDLKKNAEIAHSQQVIWKQVNQAKDSILQWLSDVNVELLDCTSNFDDIEKIKNKLTKYSEEKELNLDLKNNIVKKINKLQKLNGNKKILTLDTLCTLLNDQFTDVENIASNLVGLISAFSQQEEIIKAEIKKRISEINQIRENLIKCDNLNNELDALLVNLKSCQKCKNELIKMNLSIDTVNHSVSEMANTYPIISESTTIKELKSLKKRYESIVQQVDKVETTLMTYLKKHLVDDLNNLLHLIKSADEKLTWCKPEDEIEKEQIEIKLRSVHDINENLITIKEHKSKIDYVLDNLNQYSSADFNLEELSNNNELLNTNLKNTEKQIIERKFNLEKIISIWVEYQKYLDAIIPLVNNLENNIKMSIEIPIDMNHIKNMEENINNVQLKVNEAKQILTDLVSCVEKINSINSKSTLDNRVLKTKQRLESYENCINKCSERVNRLKEMKKEFDISYKNAAIVIKELKSKLKSIEAEQPIGKKSIQNTQSDLAIIKNLSKQLEECQQIVNDTVSKGECLYPDITMENRDEIRSKVKELRSSCDNLNDECGNITKTIENALVQKSSIDENCSQIKNWLLETEGKLNDIKIIKGKNIIDKRMNCNNLRTLKQDIVAYKDVIDQFNEKVTQINEPDINLKLKDNLKKYEYISLEVNKYLELNESYLKNHEFYLENIEILKKNIKLLLDEYTVAINASDADIGVFKNIISNQSEIEILLEKCKSIGSIVMQESNENGKTMIQNELDELKYNYESLILNCENTLKMLDQKQNQFDEVLSKIENLSTFLKSIESQIKDRSLKNSLISKQQYLNKLKLFDEDITKKHKDILEIQSNTIEVSPGVNNAMTNLIKTYQSVKTRTKELILRYDNFVREHQHFDLSYKNFIDIVNCLSEELKQHSEIVGDLGLLQERQKKLLELSDSKCQQSVQYESLVNMAEKLYAQTSPDGREIIRQQMKDLRSAWELVSESFQSSLSKLDNCLLQFAEFSLSQEQLTKWLKNIEQAMQQHTETKATLQEKKAQLQNHIVINQEIMSHQNLVQSVCDKAQELVNQTQDDTLNTYLESIKNLYQKIVKKSKELMDSLELSVQNHSEFHNVCQKVKLLLKEQREKIRENDNVAVEKDIIVKKIVIFKEMKNATITENDLRNNLEHLFKLVSKTTTKKGINVMSKEIIKIDNEKSLLIVQLDTIIEKMEEIVNQWTNFENEIDEITNWFRITESSIKDQQLQATFEDKKNKLQVLIDKRNEILNYEPKIEKFIDNSNNLLHTSRVERLKPLILQIGNRYQLLLVLSKEIVANWQIISDEHKTFIDKLTELKSWLETLENKPTEILNDSNFDLNKKLTELQSINANSEQTSARLSTLTSLGESLFPDTSASGRETIRQQLKEIREKWDSFDEQIRTAQKSLGVQSQQWNNFQDALLQTTNWLEGIEKVIASYQSPIWSSPQEIRSKLLKQKATMQEINSQSRVIETIIEKGKTIKKPNDEFNSEISLKNRYNLLRDKMTNSILQLENYIETYQQYQDLHKLYQDTQKQLWDQLSIHTDYSGNKQILESRFNKVNTIQTTFNNNKMTLIAMESFVENSKDTIPQKAVDMMSRDHTNLRFEQEKFQSLLKDLLEGLQSRIVQWVEFESLMQQLTSWHNDTEKKLQNYSEKGTLEEKTQQYNQFQDLEKEIKGKSNSVKDLIAFGDHLQQSLLDDMKNKDLNVDELIDQSNDYESLGEARLSTKVKQISSRYQSMQTTIKDILNKCYESIKINQEYVDKYNECSIQLTNVQTQFKNVNDLPLSSQAIHQYLIQKNGKLNELLDTKSNVTSLLNSCIELGEKLFLNTSTSGRENIKHQLEELQSVFDTLYDDILNVNREVKDQLTKWGGFEELYNELNQWLNNTKQILNKDLMLKSTLDEKKTQLQIYRDMLQVAIKKKQDIVKLEDLVGRIQMQQNNDILLSSMSAQYEDILQQIQKYVDKYEAIVKDHEQYTKSVMELQEWLDATHNTLILWGDTNLEKMSLLSNLDRIKNLLLSLTEEENRIHNIQKLAEKVIPGTYENGQINIRAQIDSSQQDWEGLITTVKTSIEVLEQKLNSWNEFDILKESCLTWLRETDYKIHAIDLKNSLPEKKTQFEELKNLQGIIRAKEFEIDSITEKSQNLYVMSMSNKNSQITEIVQKFHQLSIKIKELVGKWQQFVNNHLEFESNLSEAIIWLDNVDDKLTNCTDFKSNSKDDLEEKLIVIQDILLCKDDGFSKVQNCIEIGQIVLANTAPEGHKSINEALISLQEHWSSLATKMVETKSNIDESIQRWSGFLEHVKQVGKIIDKFNDALPELEEFQGTLSEKRDQLEKIKHLDEKIRCEKLEIDTLKLKAHEMLKTGHQNTAVAETQEVFNNFENICNKVKKLLNQREQQYKDHKTYKEAYEELSNFLNRSRDKIPSLKERPLSDKLAIENAIAPLETLLNKRAQGELLLDNLNTIGDIIISSTSKNGEIIIKQEIASISNELKKLFDDILTQKDNLHAIHTHWREYKDEYEKLSDWLQQIDISMKAIKNTPLASVLEKTEQVKQIQDVLNNLEKGKTNIDKFNESASPLLKSHLETYVNNQLRHLNSRYEVQVNLAKDVQRKVETNLEQHVIYENYLEKAKTWVNDAKEAIRCGNETTANSSKEVLQSRLDKILELLQSQEEGQLIIHSTVNSGEKVLRSTRSDGKDLINNQLKEIQTDWDRLVKKIATSKVHIETSLLQWADYNSSYSHLEQWILDREAKLDEVCELKVVPKTKKTQAGIGSLSIGERKATLRRTNSIVQDIVSFEPMIQKVTLKAEDLQQAIPANDITNKYHSLSIKAKDLYEKQKETVRLHQEFIDAGNDFAIWLRSAKERVNKISEPTGDKDMLSAKSVQFKVLQSELPEGQKKLEFALERAEKACSFADEEEKEIIEEEVVMLQEEFDIHNETIQKTKALLEDGIYKWTDFDEYSKNATEWLNNTEQLVQSYNKLQPNLERKKESLEAFQTHLQTLFDWQRELDILNGKAQVLLETCSDTRLSNSITQMTTKYNTLLSLAKEVMRRLELHYQEHQQHNSLYQECLDWLERTRDKLNECDEIPNSLNEVKNKLQSLKVIRQTLEQGQNRLRYITELKEKVVLSTEPQGIVKIEEDTENLKQEFDKLSNKIKACNNNLTMKVLQLEELDKFIKILNECLDDINSKLNGNDLDQTLNYLSEKKTAYEKFKSLLCELNAHTDIVNRLSKNIDDSSSSPQEIITCISRYNNITNLITNKLSAMENQVIEHETYRDTLIKVNDWLRKTRVEVQSCADTHGDCNVNSSKIIQLKDIEESSQIGEGMIKNILALIETLKDSTGPEGCDKLNLDKNQLNSDWDELKHFIKEVQSALNKCAQAWDDFNIVYKALKDWESDLTNKVNTAVSSNETFTPDDLDEYKLWLQEIINQNVSIEELTDRCELLMDLSACNWVRDDTLKIQSLYTTLLTTTQGLVSKAEKSLTDHTEFIAAKEKVEEWLNRAHGTVQDCIGEGDLYWVKDKLQTVNLVSTRITEGQYLMNGMQEVFTKALNNTLAVERDILVNAMEDLRNSWNSLNINLNSVIAHLNSLQARWEENDEAKDVLEKWLSLLESKMTEKHDFRADVGEMKTLLERLNHMINEIDEKESDFNHVITETEELSKYCKNNTLNSEIIKLKKRKNILKEKMLNRKDSLENEITQHSNYLQALQESEKWLLQISFQLMAHNSLYITNRKQTQEQIQHHQVLLNEIIQYQEVLDDLKSKGKAQILRYVASTPSIQSIVDKQLSNIQDSYNSLYNTAQQIKARLEESLLKFKQYEDMLESIWSNLDDYQPLINKVIDENWSLEEAKEQLTIYRDLLNKLQNEKTRLALAVQACEAAVASISRPSSPVESSNSQIPEQEITIRLRLEDNIDQKSKQLISEPSKILLSMLEHLEDTGIPKLLNTFTDYVQNSVDELINMISILENTNKKRIQIVEWIKEEMSNLIKIKEKPTRINTEATVQEITNLKEMLQNINEKEIEIAELVLNDSSDKLIHDLNILTNTVNEILLKKESDQNLLLLFKNSEINLQNWLDNLSKHFEYLEKGSGNTCERKLELFNEMKEDYIMNGEKLVNNLRTDCQNLKHVVNVVDAQLLDDQMKSADRRYRDFWTRMERKYEILENSKTNLIYARSKIEEIQNWITQKSNDIDEKKIINYDSNQIEKMLNYLNKINKEADTNRIVLTDSLTNKLNAIELESEPIEFNDLEENVFKPTVNNLVLLKTKLNENILKIKNMHDASQKFESTLNQCNIWLEHNENDLLPEKYKLEPLESTVAEKNVEKVLNFKTDIQNFKDGKLSDLEKNSQILSAFCDNDNVSAIQSILNDVLNKFKKVNEMINFAEEKSKSVLDNRRMFENIINLCQQWYSEVEVIMSADVRLSSLNIVEDQLQKYADLNNRSSEIDLDIEQLKSMSEQMLLCESDTLKVSDQILSLENRQKRTKVMIKDRIEMLGKYLEKMKNISNIIKESKIIISKVQSDLQELNRPVGSTMDDVKDMIISYESLLRELKDWNEKLGNNDDTESLNEIIKQQEDLINVIEKQLSKLRQLLHLHDQFMALISDIVTFITKYSSVVDEIGKSSNNIQNKIKQFDEVTIKIQECEATLLLATDKGERIAEDGSAFDHNNITQQLQSLKQQLITLRKAVEKERQKLETTAAEHMKLAADLEQVLDWIRENEALIKSRPLLEINIESVEIDLRGHEELKIKVDDHLSRLKKIHLSAQNENIEDSTMLECLSEASSFLNTIPKELKERQNYLDINKDYRLEYKQFKDKFLLWSNEAKQKLKSIEHEKTDFKNIASNLEHLKAFFDDQTINDLVTKKIKQSIDKIRPSLTSQQNDALTVEQQNINKDLDDIMNSAKQIQKQLEEECVILKEYRNIVDKVSSILVNCKYNEDPIKNIAGLFFNLEKITLVKNDLIRHQTELDSLLNKSKQVAENVVNDEIQSETVSLVKQWSELESAMSSRITLVTEVGEKWKNLEDEHRKIEIELNHIKDGLTNIDHMIRSKNQLVESIDTLHKLKNNLTICGNQLDNIKSIGESVVSFLISESQPALPNLQEDIKSYNEKHETLLFQLNNALSQLEVNLDGFNQVEARLDKFELSLNNLKPEVESFYVFDQDTERTQREFNNLSERVNEAADDLKKFIESTQNNYLLSQKLVPNDLLNKFNPLELISEELTSLMDSNGRSVKRVKTIRSEYLKDVDDVQRWLQEAEVNVQDRGSEPIKIKEHIQTIEDEINVIHEKLNRAILHGKEIVQKTKDEEEKEMIPKTLESLVGKMSQVKLWLDEKRYQIGDTLDAWQKFLSVYDLVMAWCQSKTKYLEEPINLCSLEVAKQKAHEFSAAVKSSKQQTKNLAEMNKELDIIALSTDVGHLPEKLEEANNAKNNVEGKLSEKNALLQEACEEWEQFERKLKEIKSFIDKSHNAIESTANKKRTLREQHDIREKMLADITIQRKKITLSTEKLQIHFRAGFEGSENIEYLSKDNLTQLDNLFIIVSEQAHNLEESLSQLDKYQQEIQHLRQKVISAEQQLRLTQSPTYLPHDRQKAIQEQNAFQEQIQVLQSKINSRTERIKLIIQRGSPISDPLLN